MHFPAGMRMAHWPAVLSGRDLDDVSSCVGVDGVWYAGSHGFELIGLDGAHQQNEEALGAVATSFERVAAERRERFRAIGRVTLEHKRFAVAVHYRNATEERVDTVVASVHGVGKRDEPSPEAWCKKPLIRATLRDAV
ncbi:otsB2 [Mycobacterium xenopi]|uniref:Trehalose 6-phosphate phosphatase n=3 Tax=Mycobacterium xenopi TaxID=1789 RepID=A0AAD1GZX7_MYCXE|nr:hypothetical protein MYXE_15240 [Mycobacterium xenopi]SPX93524.1 otsB2 [Mycobacterium xenopi]